MKYREVSGKAHEELCKGAKHSIEDLDRLALMGGYIVVLEEIVDNLLDPTERKKFWEDI